MAANTSNTPRRQEVDWNRFGLGTDEQHNYTNRARPRGNSTGFIDLGNEYQYAAGGHQAAGANEIFAEDQSERPWWRTNFFISQPVLFGTWDGVFTSVLINIFGVIVFLRSGWIVAQAGILNGVLIIFATVSLALISVLAAVGICERCRIESGGVYFLIAHTLGSRFGGSLGLLYGFGQAVGCALNVLGFGESMADLIGFDAKDAWHPWAIRGFATCAVLLLGVINVAGVKWVIKLQFFLLLALLCAGLNFMVGSFVNEYSGDPDNGFTGWKTENFASNFWAKYSDGYTWFRVFGVFFPTITGVLSGINMSGDLRAPSTDIPNGTLAAFGTSTVLYLVFMLFLGGTCERDKLLTDYMIAVKVSAFQFLLLAGVYVSSISSCLGAMYGTPRVLQSIALENCIPAIGILGKGRGPNKVPLYSMGVVATVTIFFIIVGDINFLAPIVTMPFLLTYACIDYSYFALAQTFDIQTKREERFRIQAQSPSYECRRYGSTNDHDNDLDHLFPERTRHKLTDSSHSSQNVPSNNRALPNRSNANIEPETMTNSENDVIFRGSSADGSIDSTNAALDNVQLANDDDDNEPIAQPIAPIHSKNSKHWYSHYCNRWVSLFGAILKIIIMMLVNTYYGITCIVVVFLVWFYVGTANPAVKPGLAAEFRLIVWLKGIFFRAFGKRVTEYEQIVVTPSCPGVNLRSDQLNEENEDFASRRRYHQTAIVQGHYVDDV